MMHTSRSEGVRKQIIVNGTFINGHCIRFVESAKNLGVYVDSALTMSVQVQMVVAACFSTIRLLATTLFDVRRPTDSGMFSCLEHVGLLQHPLLWHISSKYEKTAKRSKQCRSPCMQSQHV